MDAIAVADAPLFRIEFTPTIPELVKVNLLTFRAKRRRNLVINLIFASAATGLAIWPIKEFVHARELFGFLGFVSWIQVLLSPFTIRRTLTDYFRKHPQYCETTTATYYPQGVLIQSASADTLTRWHAFTHFTETRDMFYLHRGPGNPSILAKRVFTSQAEMETYRRLLMHYIGRTELELRHGFPVEIRDSSSSASAGVD
jgi:hypothetical protein